MTSNHLAVHDLARLLAREDAPLIIDVRTAEDFAADPRLPGPAIRIAAADIAGRAAEFRGKRVAVFCQKGLKLSEGAAAWLRHEGADAAVATGGWLAWAQAGLPAIPEALLPRHAGSGRTLWVTRERPKVDRIACPWLIRRFIDRDAVILFVAASEVLAVAERYGAEPFDIDEPGVRWTHRGELCSFDVMIEAFGLASQPMHRLARIVRGADTARLDIAPQSAGLLAISLGLSRLHGNDLAQLDAGMTIYDALFLWCQEAVDETHRWPVPPALATA